MKVAYTASGTSPDSPMNPRFGRAPSFAIHDSASGLIELVDNSGGEHAAQGAGIKAAQLLAGLGVGRLVTAHVGPNAFRALSAAGIEIYATADRTLGEAMASLAAGALTRTGSADVEGHGS